jgi:hypothetical protein
MVDSDPDVLSFIKQAARDKMKIYFSVVTECEFISGLKSDQELKALKFLNSGRFIEVNSNIGYSLFQNQPSTVRIVLDLKQEAFREWSM